MRVPISFALGYLRSVDPARHPGRRLDNSLIDNKRLLLDLAAKPALEFLEPDANRFPALQLAYRALKLGKSAPCVLNAANEVAVAEFLKGNCSYVDIPRVCSEVLECSGPQMINNFEQLRSLDSQAREFASQSRVFFPGGEKHRAV